MAMNFTQNFVRPEVVFDAQNCEHRKLFAKYVQTGRWIHSPVRFVSSEPTNIDIGTISRQVLEFYTKKEFDQNLSTIG